jgi:hypothetical protein
VGAEWSNVPMAAIGIAAIIDPGIANIAMTLARRSHDPASVSSAFNARRAARVPMTATLMVAIRPAT